MRGQLGVAAQFCHLPRLGGDVRAAKWNGLTLAWHALFYAILLAVTGASLAGGRAAAALPLSVGLVVLLGAWYGFWAVARPELCESAPLRATYLLVAGLVWGALLMVDRSYSLLGIVAFIQVFGWLGRRAALAGAGAIGVMTLAADGLRGSLTAPATLRWQGVSWGEVGGTALTVALFALCFHFFGQLIAARAKLAAAGRAQGILEERQRIAAEIHDTLTQGLASVVMLLEAAEASLAEDRADVGDRIEAAASTAREGLRDARRLVWDLRPDALERGPLGAALELLTVRLGQQAGISARTVVTGDARALPVELETSVLRVAQEALANVRHARASNVTLTVSYMDDAVALDVQDDGDGFDADRPVPLQPGGGFGLGVMCQRAEALGGTLTVESERGEGTTVTAHWPIPTPVTRAPAGGPARP